MAPRYEEDSPHIWITYLKLLKRFLQLLRYHMQAHIPCVLLWVEKLLVQVLRTSTMK